jgi:hypothetical protein
LGPIDLVQLIDIASYLTVDFGNEDALDCDWEAGVCDLKTLPKLWLSFCVKNSLFDAGVGCL